MATTTTVSRNGARAAPTVTDLTIEPAGRRRVRLPELAVGVLVTVGFALAAVLWQLNATQRDPALALARDVARGETITVDDLRVVYLASDDPIAHLGRGDAELVVGRSAVSDLPSGTLLVAGQLADPAELAPGEGVVGLSLEPGQYPFGLALGDAVNVVGAPEGGGGGVVADGAEVTAVEELAGEQRRLVSLLLPEDAANGVAAAAEAGPLRLVQVGR